MTMRVPGRLRRSALTTSRPLPSARRRSTTAKAGGRSCAVAIPPATLSAVSTTKPRISIAWARRRRSGASSSTMSRRRSDSGSPRNDIAPSSVSVRFMPQPSCWDLVLHMQAGRGLDGSAPPLNDDVRSALGQVGEIDLCASALEQGLRDEDAEPQMLRLAATAHRRPGPERGMASREIGLPKARQQMRRKSGTVIDDLDGDRVAVPGARGGDLAAGELDGILDEIAEPVHDL